jgi:hypothetical protein
MHAAPTPRPLAGGDRAFKPAWSPDGQWIAYVTWSMDGGHIWKMRADGSGSPQQLTKVPAFYTDLVFSPDGSRSSGCAATSTCGRRRSASSAACASRSTWCGCRPAAATHELIVPARGVGRRTSRGSPRIYVYSNDGLISLRYDGTDRRTHMRVTGPAGRARAAATGAGGDDAARRRLGAGRA